MDVIINDSDGSEHLSTEALHHRVRIFFSLEPPFTLMISHAYPSDPVISPSTQNFQFQVGGL